MTERFILHQLGAPILRRLASPVEDISAPDFQALLDDLMQFVLEKKGMGIAAPQVGISQQFFIMSSHSNERYPQAPDIAPFYVINPTILWQSDKQEKAWEGCLSLPGLRGYVPRASQIKVRYQTRETDWVETEYTGFLARVFQHEYDHLIGHVFIDRVESTHDIIMEAEWLKLISNKV